MQIIFIYVDTTSSRYSKLLVEDSKNSWIRKVEDAQILKTKAVTVIEKLGGFLKPQQEDENLLLV
jgi:hypothetical protein